MKERSFKWERREKWEDNKKVIAAMKALQGPKNKVIITKTCGNFNPYESGII
jgi:hypothetical protein